MTCSIDDMAPPSSSQVVLPTSTGLNKPAANSTQTTADATPASTPAPQTFDAGTAASASESSSSASIATGRRPRRVKKKKYRYACKFNASCDKIAKAGGMCIAHGGGKRCSLPGCVKVARYSGSLCHVHRTAEVDQLRGQAAAANMDNMNNNMNNNNNMNHNNSNHFQQMHRNFNNTNNNMAANHSQFAASMAAAVQQQHQHHQQQQQQQLPSSPLFRHHQHLQHELQQQLYRVNSTGPSSGNMGSQGPSRTPTPLLPHPPGYNNCQTQPSSADLLLAMYGLSSTIASSSSSPVASSTSSPTALMGINGSMGSGLVGAGFPNSSSVPLANPYFGSDSSGLIGMNSNSRQQQHQQHMPMSSMMPLSTMMSSSVGGMLNGPTGSAPSLPNNWMANNIFRQRQQQAQQYYQFQQPTANNNNQRVGDTRRRSDVSQDVAPKRSRVENPSEGLMPTSVGYTTCGTMSQLHSIMSAVATTSAAFPVSGYTATSSGFSGSLYTTPTSSGLSAAQFRP